MESAVWVLVDSEEDKEEPLIKKLVDDDDESAGVDVLLS